MSFAFEWPRFSDQFHKDAIQLVEAALNKGNKPPVIADRIEVVELEMGTQVCALDKSCRKYRWSDTGRRSHQNSRFAILETSP